MSTEPCPECGREAELFEKVIENDWVVCQQCGSVPLSEAIR